MTAEFLITRGVLFCLCGTLVSAVAGASHKHLSAHRLSQGMLIAGNLAGALAAVAFMLQGTERQFLFHLPFLFDSTFVFDRLSALFFLLVTVITSLTGLFAIRYLEAYRTVYNLRSLNCIAALFVFGMQTVLLVTNIAGFMLFWEIMSIASFFLVMADRKDASIKAAFLYLTMTQLGASALFGGFFLLGNGTPFPDFATMAGMSGALPPSTIALSFALLFFGFGSKAGLVPFHLWLPEAHPRAPSHISALMSGVMLKIALYGFLRTVFFLLPPLHVAAGLTVLGLGLLSGLFGVLHAVVDRDIKRTLAFSSIENLGLIFTMMGLSMVAETQGLHALAGIALVAALFHAVNHAIFKTGLFFCAGIIIRETHVQRLEALGGLAKTMPLFTMAFSALALAASALPPFGTFYGEWMFLEGIIDALQGGTLLMKVVLLVTLGMVVLVSALAVFAMVKVFAIASLGAPRSVGAAHAQEPDSLLRAPITFLALLTVLPGILAPALLQSFSPEGINVVPQSVSTLRVGTGFVSPLALFLVLLGLFALSGLLPRFLGNARRRISHVWDCGQEVNAHMEYTATAFSSPIRFFFRFLLHHRKSVIASPVVATNPWIATHIMSVNADSVWFDTLYAWIARILFFLSMQAKRLQNGILQFYLFLIFLPLVLALLIAL